MSLLQRIGYYLGGFSVGLIVLAVFLNGKNVGCDYGPSARVKKNITTKPLLYSEKTLQTLQLKQLDSIYIKNIISDASVNFSDSNPRQEPCGIYKLEGDDKNSKVILTIENCPETATITEISWK